ncbi:nondiscriminating glutamyl-tRNA synthetase [Syntrophus gentianae]|uniref:Glutamate--tRNA ligase n=1 Tax=Syntrophus gentianae TaxID=43775 RepID=A0A1H8APK1_9BACT|nr:glutamate--tRNA ligase [Syntrophus gentianae]SEM72655.1 nondiscriminating glutamyl-tRNA synthetase [Syntrophus gentianae]
MNPKIPRVRFAPSPTGDLHIGNARTAFFNWLYARHFGGRLILRIEDTDQERTTKAFEDNLLEDLKWLTLDWDEGPEREGSVGPYRQSERLALYESFLKILIKEERVYPCYCTEEELELERTALLSRKIAPRYMGKCRNLTLEERRRLEAQGRKPTYRFRVQPGTIAFQDRIRGLMRFEGEAIGDFIIVRSNGIPAYNFAVVIDDHFMEISSVIRGEDHLSNTAIQLMLYEALGFAPPEFAHHSLILGKDRTKLSKRHGSVSVREFREKGILPEALLNYLALLGGSIGEGREVCPVEEIIAAFSLDRAGKSGAIFDEDKLVWMNSLYIHNESPNALKDKLLPFIRKAGYDANSLESQWLDRMVEVVQPNLATMTDIGPYLVMLASEGFPIEEDAASLLQEKDSQAVIRALLPLIEEGDFSREDFYPQVMTRLRNVTGVKGKKLFMPVRAALTGSTRGPELDRIFSLLGRQSVTARLSKALST